METLTKGVAIPPKNNTVAKESSHFSVIDIESKELANLDKAQVVNFDLNGDYWTPETEGETKRVIFTHISQRDVESQFEEGRVDTLETAFFLDYHDGAYTPICNASKRLVGVLKDYAVAKGTALQITYKGKKKNSTNSYKSDDWSIKPLKIV